MCEVLQADRTKQPSYSLTDIESTPSSVDLNTSEEHGISFHCGDSDEFQDPCPISLTEEKSASVLILEGTENKETPSKKAGNGQEEPMKCCSSSCDLRYRKCSAPLLCSSIHTASLSDQGISLEDVSPFSKKEVSYFTRSIIFLSADSFNFTPNSCFSVLRYRVSQITRVDSI